MGRIGPIVSHPTGIQEFELTKAPEAMVYSKIH